MFNIYRYMSRMKNKRNDLVSEVIDINGSKVSVENGKVKTVLNEEIQRTGWMTVEEAMALTENKIRKLYEMNGKL